jgi:hypothetical protein
MGIGMVKAIPSPLAADDTASRPVGACVHGGDQSGQAGAGVIGTLADSVEVNHLRELVKSGQAAAAIT